MPMTPFTTLLLRVVLRSRRVVTAGFVLLFRITTFLILIFPTQVRSGCKSIHNVLNTGDNAEILLALHQPKTITSNHDVDDCNGNTWMSAMTTSVCQSCNALMRPLIVCVFA
jgi:hypothetical protein